MSGSHSYRRRVETIDAIQYDGTNGTEMLAFAPDYLEMRGGVLCQVRNPFPVAVTEWVFRRTADGVFGRMTDDIFQATWQPGGAAPLE